MEYVLNEGEGKKTILFFVPDDKVENVINRTILDVTSKSLDKEKVDEIYLCIKEIVNYFTAVNILRATGGDKISFDSKVRLLLNDSYLNYFKGKAIARKNFIEVRIIERKDGIMIEVINSEPIPQEHEKKIRDLMRKLSSGEEINFSLMGDNYDFIYSILTIWSILGDLGIDRKYFRLGNIDNRALVRIEIPFSENYTSIRDED
ncbi:MAG: hypothetical protein ACPL4C_01310 [Brevinematia bacterium]